jgi:ABC-type glycerol-3-phosphate transport system permease component
VAVPLTRRVRPLAILAVLLVVAVVMLFPFAYMLIVSFRSPDQYLAGEGFSVDSWEALFEQLPVVQQMVNSAIVTLSAVALIVITSTMAGFAFAKLRFPLSPLLFVGILAGMMIPVQSIIIPEYVNIANVGLINQYPGPILVYAVLGIPFATYLMTAYFRGVPDDIIEASRVDGAGYGQVFRTIMLPLAVPALVTVAVLQFIQIWGDLLIGLLFLQQPEVRTITVGLATLQSSRIIPVTLIMAGSIISLLPAVIVYLIFQRQLITGLTMGMGK